MLEDLEPLRPKVLHEKLEGAEALLEQAVCAHASNPLDLAKAYVLLARIETDATAALDEAAVGAVWADENGKPKRSTKYEGVQDAARELLAGVGRAYALNCSAFSAILLGDSVWPTRYEAPKSGGALLFINGFKMTADLSPEARKAVFAERLEEFLGAGGQMEQVRILDKSGIEALEVGERYEYVLLSDKRIRFAAIPKKEEGIGPGHSVLAEGGFVFRDARALCAGEFWVSRGPDGDITAFSISCGSGHFKPFFDALSEVNGPLAKLGLEPDRIVHYGGPSSARKAARKLFEKAGLSKAEAKARLPLAVPLRRLEWRSLVQV